MNKKIETIVILLGTMQSTQADQAKCESYVVDLRASIKDLLYEANRDHNQFTAAELVIINWIKIVAAQVLKEKRIHDEFESDAVKCGVA